MGEAGFARDVMRSLAGAIDHLRWKLSPLWQLWLMVRARRPSWVVLGLGLILGVALLGLVVSGAAEVLRGPPREYSPEEIEAQWRYLVVCQRCGYRARQVTHPRGLLAERDGLLVCPECGEAKAWWYRRGSQAIPPGGWSVEEAGGG